ncbi:MAG: hypothetical protein AB4368_20625 [Xenococcaceae cyanobacterium]
MSQESVAVMISLVTHDPRSPEYYKNLLENIPSLAHVSIEVNPFEGEPRLQVASTINSIVGNSNRSDRC